MKTPYEVEVSSIFRATPCLYAQVVTLNNLRISLQNDDLHTTIQIHT